YLNTVICLPSLSFVEGLVLVAPNVDCTYCMYKHDNGRMLNFGEELQQILEIPWEPNIRRPISMLQKNHQIRTYLHTDCAIHSNIKLALLTRINRWHGNNIHEVSNINNRYLSRTIKFSEYFSLLLFTIITSLWIS